jgi:hypothetical protein
MREILSFWVYVVYLFLYRESITRIGVESMREEDVY